MLSSLVFGPASGSTSNAPLKNVKKLREQNGFNHIPKERAEYLYRKFVAFEKQFGDREGIEDAIIEKRRLQYEEEVRKNPLDYDSWFDYIRLEESVGNKSRIREVYERAIANVPPADEKRYWQRYIYLWISYALYEKLDAQDVSRTRDVYRVFENAINYYRTSAPELKEERAMLLEEWLNMVLLGMSYLFPRASNLNILERAYEWKRKKVASDD
ncbi:hypothetical protein L1987_01236 [Smallanthus sonchifolius]|uniref:Uncharacterized protein n=2 Tax=Smallanthus sonchifolius TaxID=185202 RepID=A0ACB9K4G4_9ASTR|nr:hypothetical protein L1987_01235 [Smallanthus sonchifolius]KAI3827166.1 hypothetical protein L1987_01236 [Smallanthus sonchifolius]